MVGRRRPRAGRAPSRRRGCRQPPLRILVEVMDVPARPRPGWPRRSCAWSTTPRCAGCPRLLHGEEEGCWPLVAQAAREGLPTRIGLEDTTAGPDGEPVSGNAELVRCALGGPGRASTRGREVGNPAGGQDQGLQGAAPAPPDALPGRDPARLAHRRAARRPKPVCPGRRFPARRAQPEQLDRVIDGGEPGLGRDLLGPALHRAALDLDAGPAVAADQVVVVGVALAPAVQRLPAGVPDRVHLAVLAEHLQVPVDGGQADVLATLAQLGMDLLGAAEPGQPVQDRRQRLSLPGPAHPGAAQRTRSRHRRHHTRTLAAWQPVLPSSAPRPRGRVARRPRRPRPSPPRPAA